MQISDLAREEERGLLGIRLVVPPTIYIGEKPYHPPLTRGTAFHQQSSILSADGIWALREGQVLSTDFG